MTTMGDNHHQQKTSSTSGTKLPTGYNCFAQGLAEVVNKIKNQEIRIEEIKDVDLYKNHPETLSEKYPPLGKKGWYFVTRRNRKYRNGLDVDRKVDGYGYWKANGGRTDIPVNGELIGWRNTLVFHQREHGKDTKTNWSMDEYGTYISQIGRDTNGMELDYVVCQIKKETEGNQGQNHQVDESSPNSQVTDTEIQTIDNNEEDPAVPVDHDNATVASTDVPVVNRYNNGNLPVVKRRRRAYCFQQDLNEPVLTNGDLCHTV